MTSAEIDDVVLHPAVTTSPARATPTGQPDDAAPLQAAGSAVGLLVLWAGPVAVYLLLLVHLW